MLTLHNETGSASADTAVALLVVGLSIAAIIVAIAGPLAAGAAVLDGLLLALQP